MRRRRQMRSAVPRQGAELAKYLVVVLIATFVQAAQSKPLLGHLPSHPAKKAADLTKVVPVFPTATDYASGVCAGYAFCFANWNPPVFTEPDVLCPSGYEVTQQYGKPFCVQKLGLCPSGYDLSSSGQCCTVKTQSQCYANWDECSAAGGSFSGDDVGSICKGSPEYTNLVNQIDMVEVTPRSIISDSPASQTQHGTTLPTISSPTLSGKGLGTHTIIGDGGGSSIVLNDDTSSNIPSSIGGSMGSSVIGSNGQGLDAMPGNGAGGNGQVVNGISSNTIIGNGQLPDSVAGYGGSSMGAGGPQNVGVQVGVPGVGSGSGNGNTIPTVVPGNGNAALPPGSIVVDDNNGVLNPNLPIISVEEPAAAVAPPPIIINIDSNGAAHVNGGAAGNQVLINQGAGRGFSRAGNGLPMQGGNNGGQVGSGLGNGISNPAVIPAGSLVNLNGRLVRIGGASAAAGSGGTFDGQAAGFPDQIQPGMVQAPVGAGDAMMGDVQTIPSGSFVDLGGGRVVQVGPKATGRSQMQAGAGAVNRPASPQQQQALLDLQQQADASGTSAWMPRFGPAAATPTAPPAGGAPATVPGGAGNAGLVGDDSISQPGAQLGESEWEEPAEDQQEVGRVLMPEAVPIFEGLRYESNSYEATEASHPAGIVKKAVKKAAGSSTAKQQQQWARKKIQPQYASGTQTNYQHQYHAQRKLQQSNMRLAGAASRGSGADAAGDVSIASYADSSSSGSSSSRSGSSVGVAMLPPPHPAAGVVLMRMLLLLPKLEIAKLSLMSKAGKLALAKMGATQVGKLAAQELLATKEVLASFNTHKEDLLPKCFNKCCTQDADVICTPAKQTINYARPQLTCPSGCELNTVLGKCVCRPGSFSPCLPTDTVCSWGDQPICVGSAEFFGVPACTFVGALQKHLPRVQCPY